VAQEVDWCPSHIGGDRSCGQVIRVGEGGDSGVESLSEAGKSRGRDWREYDCC